MRIQEFQSLPLNDTKVAAISRDSRIPTQDGLDAEEEGFGHAPDLRV